MLDLSIIIVNYNGIQFLAGCLDSIAAKVTCEHEIIVVDNASTDQSADLVESRYPSVRLIRSRQNLGFARGNNLAARQAMGRYLLLLNNDTILLDDVAPFLDLLGANPHIGVIGANMLDRNMREQACTGNFPNPARLVKFSTMLIKPHRHKVPLGARLWAVDWVQGSFLLTSAVNWRALGGLDEQYFMYIEDTDFCKRTRLRGLRTAYCASVRYIHFGGFCTGRFHFLYTGHLRFQAKFSGILQRATAVAVLEIGLVLRMLLYGIRVPGKDDPASNPSQ
jgi:GT2 family glycosyltransferase